MPDTRPASQPRSTAPVRTCIGCRRACPAAELVRVVLVDGQPKADARRRLPGRGASIHPREDCVNGALKRGGFARAFRRQVIVTAPSEFLHQVEAAFVFSREPNRNPG